MKRENEFAREENAEQEKIVLYQVKGQKAYITMNKPKSGNCVNRMATEALYRAFSRAEAEEEVKVVIFRGNGRTFCAGGDVPRMNGLQGCAVQHDEVRASGQVIRQIVSMQKPVICAVQGFAAGAGLGLALACDLILCERSARFMTAFSNVGLASDCGAAYMLAKTLGKHKAKELLLLSDVIGAQEMKDLGLIAQVTEDGGLEEAVEAMAERLLARPLFAGKFIKTLVNRSDEMDLETSILYEEALQTVLMNTEDFQEGTQAFLQKRPPVFGQAAGQEEKTLQREKEDLK